METIFDHDPGVNELVHLGYEGEITWEDYIALIQARVEKRKTIASFECIVDIEELFNFRNDISRMEEYSILLKTRYQKFYSGKISFKRGVYRLIKNA